MLLISGVPHIDVADWEQHTRVSEVIGLPFRASESEDVAALMNRTFGVES